MEEEKKDSLRDLLDNTKYNNICMIGVPEREESEQRIWKLFEEIMTEKLFSLMDENT